MKVWAKIENRKIANAEVEEGCGHTNALAIQDYKPMFPSDDIVECTVIFTPPKKKRTKKIKYIKVEAGLITGVKFK